MAERGSAAGRALGSPRLISLIGLFGLISLAIGAGAEDAQADHSGLIDGAGHPFGVGPGSSDCHVTCAEAVDDHSGSPLAIHGHHRDHGTVGYLRAAEGHLSGRYRVESPAAIGWSLRPL